MKNVLDWLEAKPQSSRLSVLVMVALVPVTLVVASAFLFPPAAPLAGCAAGIGLFVAGYGYWHTLLSAEQQEATNLRARVPLRNRRGISGSLAAGWVVCLLLAGEYLPAPVLGVANVVVLLSLYTFVRATPAEAAEALAAYEAAQAEKEAARAAAEAEDDEDA